MSRRAALAALLGVLTAVGISVAPSSQAHEYCLVLAGDPSGRTNADGLCVNLPIDPRP